jgi:RimJ/RimL family protein N-acetyltransferase
MYRPGDVLPAEILSRKLPLKPAPVELETARVKLVPLSIPRDANNLFLRTNGSAITLNNHSVPAYDANNLWKYLPYGPFPTLAEFIAKLEELQALENSRLFCIVDKNTNSQIGMISLGSDLHTILIVEIKDLVLSPIAQKSGMIYEVLYLAVEYLMKIGYRRIEAKVYVQNIPGLQSCKKVGMTVERIERYFGRAKGVNVDVAWMRICDFEWEEKKTKVQQSIFRTPAAIPKI